MEMDNSLIDLFKRKSQQFRVCSCCDYIAILYTITAVTVLLMCLCPDPPTDLLLFAVVFTGSQCKVATTNLVFHPGGQVLPGMSSVQCPVMTSV